MRNPMRVLIELNRRRRCKVVETPLDFIRILNYEKKRKKYATD